MPKLPTFPDLDQLHSLAPLTRIIDAGSLWHRIYRRGGKHPTQWAAFRYYGPTNARFDHHLTNAAGQPHTQQRGIIYLAGDIPTSIAEVYQSSRTLDRKLGKPWLASMTLSQPLTLLDLTDTFLVQAGGSMKLISGARSHARNWSQGFYETYTEIDGLYFSSSMTNRPILALYERALKKNSLPSSPDFHRALDDPLIADPLQEACVDIRYEFT